MIVGGSNLLSGIGGPLNATPQMGDSDVSIPPVLMPEIKLQEPCTYGLSLTAGAGLGLAVQTSSHIIGYVGTRAAAAGSITDRFVRLGPGLWRLSLAVCAFAAAAADGIYIEWAMGTASGSGGGSGRLLDLTASGAIIALSQSIDTEILVPKDYSFIVTAIMNNTSGATPCRITAAGYAAKLG